MNHGGADGPGGNAPAGPPPSLIERAVAPLARLGAAFSVLGVLLILAITGYSVFMRYVLGTPVTWTDELSGYLVVGIVMLGAAETLRRGDHISVDLISARLSGIWARVAGIWAMVAVILLVVAILISSITAVRFSHDFGIYSDGYLAIAMWIPQSLLVIGCVLILLVAAARLVSVLLARRPRQ
ncbi:MAG: TRAP transporter small permease [Minwuia sp.]|uniref:TRAP transporter small permease n=1 Tax=Minwuia sp. TaxID=2493630 RepID=UPI003A87AC67